MTLFTQLAAGCAPAVHIDTLAAVASAESGFETNAIYDNTAKRRYVPGTRAEAIAIATNLIEVKHHSVDLGLMQINSANLRGMDMKIAEAFEPCENLRVGARVLVAAYSPPGADRNTDRALQEALSRYNTGNATQGFANGYVARVLASAKQVVPALRLNVARAIEQEGNTATPSPPAIWDVFGQAKYQRQRHNTSAAPHVIKLQRLQPALPRSTVDLQAADCEVCDAR